MVSGLSAIHLLTRVAGDDNQVSRDEMYAHVAEFNRATTGTIAGYETWIPLEAFGDLAMRPAIEFYLANTGS